MEDLFRIPPGFLVSVSAFSSLEQTTPADL